MSRTMRLYYYAVLGAMGGLIGWQASNMLGLSFWSNLYLSEVLVGGLIGLSIGLLLGVAEQLGSRSPLGILKSGAINGVLGLIGGGIALPVDQDIGRLDVAMDDAVQAWKPALGGGLGGLLGGFLLEEVRSLFSEPLYGKAVGLTLLGAAVGIFIALVVLLLTRAWLEVASGKMKGSEFILDKFIKSNGPSAFIGSSPLKSDIVLPDPDIAPQHALLKGEDSHFTLRDLSLSGTFVNGRKIELTQLRANQSIKMGNTELIYRERK
ncbi:MAG: FHA domain-containing protein [Anaerolineales bacterium]